MRVSLFAGLAALVAAVDLDDEDMNFLRLLSSNVSNSSSTASTAAAASTAASNATAASTAYVSTAASNGTTATTAASSGTTAGATSASNGTTTATTTAAAGEATTAATTGMAAEGTTMASSEGTTAAATTKKPEEPASTTSTPQDSGPELKTMCSAESYKEVGMEAPSTMKATTHKLKIVCVGEGIRNHGVDEKSTFYDSGDRAFTAANKKKCTDLGGTVTELVCGTDATFAHFKDHKDSGMLAACCGYPAAFGSHPLVSPKTGGKYSHTWFTDADCTVKAKGADFKNYAYEQEFPNGEGEYDLGKCHDLGYVAGGGGIKWTGCNSTHSIMEMFYDASCSIKEGANLNELTKCTSYKDGGGNSTIKMETTKCEGGSTPAKMEILSTGKTTLTGIPADLPEADKTKVIDSASETYRAAVQKASGDKPTTIESATGTGNLAPATRRRLSSRRLAAATQVITITATSVPTAEATTVKGSLDDATATGGDLSPDKLGAEMVTAIKAEVATLGNITAQPVVAVSEPSIPVDNGGDDGPGGGGSTSSAVTESLAYGAGLALLASLMM